MRAFPFYFSFALLISVLKLDHRFFHRACDSAPINSFYIFNCNLLLANRFANDPFSLEAWYTSLSASYIASPLATEVRATRHSLPLRRGKLSDGRAPCPFAHKDLIEKQLVHWLIPSSSYGPQPFAVYLLDPENILSVHWLIPSSFCGPQPFAVYILLSGKFKLVHWLIPSRLPKDRANRSYPLPRPEISGAVPVLFD